PFDSERVLHPLVNRRQTATELGMYVQDSFKVNARLTLDYGIRWDYFPAARYDDGLMYNWDKTTGAVVVPPDALDAVSVLYPDTIEVRGGDVIAKPDTGNLRPRASLAYRLNERTVIRGGYGAFTERLDDFVGAQGGGPFESGESYQNIVQPGERPLFAFPTPFPGLAFASGPSQDVSSYPLQIENGTIHQFNVSVERELMPRVGLRLSYIGSRGVGLNYLLNINKPEPGTTPFTTDRRPWPQFVDVNETRSDGSARYDAVQAQVQKRAGAFTFNAHYTWARDEADYLNDENPYDVTGHWFNASDTRRHYAMVNTNWELPFGRDRRFLPDAPPLVDQLVGGWTVSTVSYFGSGTFFTPAFSGADPSNTGTSGGVPDRIGAGNLPGDQRDPTRWFNPGDFAVPPEGRFGNAGVNILEADGLHVHHVSLSKESRLAGGTSLTFTVTASNIFDQVHFGNPEDDISTATAGTISEVMSDFQAERGGRRMVTLKGIFRF
ncbi:MAG: TonB-dependent receptor domain-containing protein, partial [Vicinamibacteraceae bacterium]